MASPDLLDKAHIDAALGLLRADTSLTVYPDAAGNVPAEGARADHYVLVYSTIERPRAADGNALDGRSVAWTVRWYCHCVGASSEASSWAVAMRVNRALMDVRPVITGRACDLIEQEAANPPSRDETTGTPVFDTVSVYRLRTLPG
jgi:hypothetical protein